jgi:uncharacterized protein (DUF2132 family)
MNSDPDLIVTAIAEDGGNDAGPVANQHDASRQDPLHGITLENLLNHLLEKYGWDGLAERIDIKCFTSNPSIASSLKFLRKTPWARQKVEVLYLQSQGPEGKT